MLLLEKPVTKRVTAHLLVSDCMVGPAAPALPIRVSVNGSVVEDWVLGPDRTPHVRSLEIPVELLAGRTELLVAFTVPDPRSPSTLGWSNDTRRLGIRLTRAVVGRAGVPPRLTEASVPQPLRQ